jgi:hypothetical protein
VTLSDRQRGWMWIALGVLGHFGIGLSVNVLMFFSFELIDSALWPSFQTTVMMLAAIIIGYIWMTIPLARGLGWLGFAGHRTVKLHRASFPWIICFVLFAWFIFHQLILASGYFSDAMIHATSFLDRLGPHGAVIERWLWTSGAEGIIVSGISGLGQLTLGLVSLVSMIALSFFGLGSVTWIKSTWFVFRNKFWLLILVTGLAVFLPSVLYDLADRHLGMSMGDLGFVFTFLLDTVVTTFTVLALLWFVIPSLSKDGETLDASA